MGLKNNPREHEEAIFASILSDGKIHVSVPEGTEGAVKREYETSDGKEGFKWEHVYTELVGLIQKIEFREGDYGVNLVVTVGAKDDEKPVKLSLSTESNFGEDLMKKLPNIDQKREVCLEPFSFLNDKGKKTRGIVVSQQNKKGEKEKVYNFYYDIDEKKVANGYPVPPKGKGGKPVTKSEWRKYFSDARDFLMEDLKERLKIEEVEEATMSVHRKAAKDF